ncbi:MAG: hypothetical protein FK733_09405 [Asgard group archaeon]|nr:hypothetical protein [Asgard group archaeon]
MSEDEACDVESQVTMFDDIKNYINSTYPEFDSVKLLEDKATIVQKSDMICNDLTSYYHEHKQYNLHWAFKQAQESIILRQEKMSKKIESLVPNYREITVSTSKATKLRFKRMHNMFNFLSFLVQFVDIAISVALIVLVTILSGRIEQIIHSIALNVLFVALIALAKVSLDRFVVVPQIDKWGWRRYLKGINYMRNVSVKLIGIGIVMDAAVKQDFAREQVIELFLRNFKEGKIPFKVEKQHMDKLWNIIQEKKKTTS